MRLTKVFTWAENSTVGEVLDWVQNYIASHKMLPGNRLPSESEISRLSGAGRNTVREAIACMKTLGIVKSKTKVGLTLIRDPSIIQFQRVLTSRYIPDELRQELVHLRCALEIGFIPIIIDSIQKKEIRELHALAVKMEKEGDIVRQLEFDAKFHASLLLSTGNCIAAWLTEMFRPLFLQSRAGGPPLSKKTHRDHKSIVEALKNRDKKKFNRVMIKHIKEKFIR